MFVFKKADKDVVDEKEAKVYERVAFTAAAMFAFFAIIRVA